MQKTKIEWCDYTINPVKGMCPMACSYCYARAMYHRFKWDPEIKYDRYLMPEMIEGIQKPSRIFVGSTMELFGEWIYPHWLDHIFTMVKHYKEHTFIFLTKRPERLNRWKPYPDNCWIGVSITNNHTYIGDLLSIKAPVKFLSIEPLLEWVDLPHQRLTLGENLKDKIDWIIIGQQTPVKEKTKPKTEWINEILNAADDAGIPVFLKDNLKSLYPGYPWLRQEFPKVPEKVR